MIALVSHLSNGSLTRLQEVGWGRVVDLSVYTEPRPQDRREEFAKLYTFNLTDVQQVDPPPPGGGALLSALAPCFASNGLGCALP